MIFYKGAGPGTHWWTNDARITGFSASPGVANTNSMVRHITAYSHPSPMLSFSASFAVARSYALSGPAGRALASSPGYVYEIDITQGGLSPALLKDPVREILNSNPDVGTVALLPTHHDGGQNLLHAIASPSRFGATLGTPPIRRGPNPRPPVVSDRLQAVIFALRDAEVLVSANVASACVVTRYNVH